MRFVQKQRRENSLIRWVHRHADITTLFSPRRSSKTEFIFSSVALPRQENMPGLQLSSEAIQRKHQTNASPNETVLSRQQTPTTPAQLHSPAQIQTPQKEPLPSDSSHATGNIKDQDEHWQRLQKIFRKHQEQEEMSLNLPEETTAPAKMEPLVPNVEQDSREMDISKPVQHEQRIETFLQKHQEPESERSVGTPEAGTTETESVKPPAPGANQGNDSPKLKHELRQTPGMIRSKEPKQAIAKLHSAPQATVSERESIQPIAAQPQQNERPKQSELPGSGMLLRQYQEPATAKAFDAPDIRDASKDNEPRKQNVGKIQREPQRREAKPVNDMETKISQAESARTIQPGGVQENEKPSFKERVWQGLKSIFRKPQESNETKTAGTAEPAEPGIETTEPHLDQTTLHTDEPARSGETSRRLNFVQPSATSVLSSEPVQRSTENIELQVKSPETKMPKKGQASLSLAADPPPAAEVESPPSVPDDTLEEASPEIQDRSPAMDQIQDQPVPLQFAWNVQQVDVPESPRLESMKPQHSETNPRVESMLSRKFDEAGEQEVNIKSIGSDEQEMHITETNGLPPTRLPSFEGSRTPVEILTPSRPRPARSSVNPRIPTVQRQSENRHPIAQSQASPLVSTAIGPLPTDLWSLLGQQAPASEYEPGVGDKTSTSGVFSQQEIAREAEFLSSQPASDSADKSGKAVPVTAVLQRQAFSNNPATSTDHEQAQVPQTQETTQSEPDLDGLAQKVYAEVRRRLATEWERTRRPL